MGIVGIHSLIHLKQLEDSVCKIFDKQNCNTSKDTFEEFFLLKGDRVIDKFYRRKCSRYQVSKMA